MSLDFNDTPKLVKKRLSPTDALTKIKNYCAYQERSHKEVRKKLFNYGLYASEVDEIISSLITDGFLNEERFAKAFAGGKFRMKKWGRLKIQNELEMQGLTARCVKRALQEIDDTDYKSTLKDLLKKKLKSIAENNTFRRKDKLARYAISKGYEPELVWTFVKELVE